MNRIQVSFYELDEREILNTTSIEPGAFICCKDNSNIYIVPTAGGKPVKMGETVKFISDSERLNLTNIVNKNLFFCYDTGKMWIYYNEWICINAGSVSEFNIENVILTNSGSVTVTDPRITVNSNGIFIPDLSVNDLVSDISVICGDGTATITGVTSYDIPGVLKIN